MSRSAAIAVVLAGLGVACARHEPPAAARRETAAAPAPAPPAAPPSFNDVTAGSGIAFVHDAGHTANRWLPETMGSGVAVLDVDGDGRQDLYFVDQGPVPADDEPPGPGNNKLYRNLGNWRFEDVTGRAGVRGRAGGMGAAAGDVDGDGDTDLFVTGYRSTVLYRNAGDGTFEDVTASSGASDGAWTTGAAFFDFDADGKLDLFVQRYARWSVAIHRPCRQGGVEVYCTPDLLDAVPNRLLKGRGDGTFEDVSAAAGIAAQAGKGLGVVAGDFDGDGDADVYCANDTFRNFLFENLGGGKFRESGLVSGAGYGADGREEAGMGTDAADLDGDGLAELVVANFQNEPNDLYRNEGRMSFTEVSSLSGLAGATRTTLGFGVKAADFDLDGLADIAFANGHVYDNAAQATPGATYAQPALFLRNAGSLRFNDATASVGGALAAARVARGLATADLDDDGDLDLVMTTNGGAPVLLRNEGPGVASWLRVRCVGTKRDGSALGARVTVRAGGREQVQEVRSGGSYLSQSDLRLVFGLGAAERAESVTVRWPGGAVEEAKDVAARRGVTFVEGKGLAD